MDILKSPHEEREQLRKLFDSVYKGVLSVDEFTEKRSLYYDITAIRERSGWNASWAKGGYLKFVSSGDSISYSIRIVGKLYLSEKESFQCYLLTPDKERFTLKEESIIMVNDREYAISIPNSIAEKVIVNGTKLSFRVKSEEVLAYLKFNINSPARVFKAIASTKLADEETDDIYDECVESLEAEVKAIKEEEARKREEELEAKRKAEEERLAAIKEKEEQRVESIKQTHIKYANSVAKIANINIYDFNSDLSRMEHLFTQPAKFKSYRTLKDFCEKENIHSDVIDYVDSLGSSKTAEVVLNDIKRARKLSKNKDVLGKCAMFFWVPPLISIFVCFFSESLAESEVYAVFSISLISIVFLFYVFAFFYSFCKRFKPDPKTLKFIKEFPEEIDKRKSAFGFNE